MKDTKDMKDMKVINFEKVFHKYNYKNIIILYHL